MDVESLDEKLFVRKVSPGRQNRIMRMKLEDDRRRGLGSELLRNYAVKEYVKKRYTEEAYESVRYDRMDNGKPVAFMDDKEIMFNVSHSGKYVVVAVGDKVCGVDVEGPRPMRQSVVDRCFTGLEQIAVEKASNPEKAFVTIWTMKESYLKMTGEGIRSNLSNVETYFDESMDNYCHDGVNYQVFHKDDYIVTLCYKGQKEDITQYTVTLDMI